MVRRLHASFDDAISRMSWECATKSGQRDVAATDEGGVRFEWGSTAATPASIAEQMLDALLLGECGPSRSTSKDKLPVRRTGTPKVWSVAVRAQLLDDFRIAERQATGISSLPEASSVTH